MIKLSQFVIAILSSLSIISCSKNNDVLTIEDEGNNDSELPTQIKSNTIIYKTNDNIILRFENEDVFGGAKIISNLYSTSQGCGTITFGSEVTAIEKSAFEHFENLTDIILPNTVATIGEDAFNDCNNLSNIYIPSSVRKIGKNAFSCFGIESVHIENLGAWCEIEFATCQSNPLHDKDCRLYIDGKIIQKLNIPNSVRSIKNYAFYNSHFTHVDISNSVISIGDEAFYGCSNLTQISIPNSVTNLGNSVFQNCTKLTEVSIGNSVFEIGKRTFYGCNKLNTVTISKSLKSIGTETFYNCYDLTNIVIPNSIKRIENYAFYNCHSLTNFIIPNSVEYIGDEVFSGCSNLTSINIPDSVISIGEETFCGCNQLDSVVIGKSVNSLGEGIFYLVPDENEESYQNLEKIVIKAQNPPYVRGEIVVGYSTYEVSRFYNTVTLEVPKGTLTAYRKSNTWNKFKNIKEFRDGTNINQETNADTKSRTVLLEYFTGQACVNSLDAHEMVTELHEEYQDNLIVVAIHAGKLAITAPTGLKQPEGDVYADNYGVKFYPNGLINRRGGLKFYPSWGTAVYEELQHESNLNLSVSSIVTEGKLTINTELLALEDVTGKLQLWITEDNIVGPQVSLTGADLQYVHNHVFRSSVNGTWGEDVSLKSGKRQIVTHKNFTIDSAWKAQNLSVIAFVYNKEGILQATKCKLTVRE